MISIKKYLDSDDSEPQQLHPDAPPRENDPSAVAAAGPARGFSRIPDRTSTRQIAVLPAAIEGYRSALTEMGKCSQDACPALGPDLKRKLGKLAERLGQSVTAPALLATEQEVRERLQEWGQQTAEHYQQKTEEVKGMLLSMARAAESVGERDQRCAGQLNEVTGRLRKIATLEDLTEMRASIEASAAELKGSVERMTEEGRTCMAQLRAELSEYQARLEKVEEQASRDGLTGLRNRHWMENQIGRRIAAQGPLSVAIVDIDGFKQVNDEHGHLVGDEVLQQFAAELQSACRATDLTGRWGGDEFILVMDCELPEAEAKVDRLRMWVCGNYKVQGGSAPLKLSVEASIGLAQHRSGESMKDLLARADAAMYAHKSGSRSKDAHRKAGARSAPSPAGAPAH